MGGATRGNAEFAVAGGFRLALWAAAFLCLLQRNRGGKRSLDSLQKAVGLSIVLRK